MHSVGENLQVWQHFLAWLLSYLQVLGRAGLEGAPPRLTIKEGHILEGHLTAGEYLGRYRNAGEVNCL